MSMRRPCIAGENKMTKTNDIKNMKNKIIYYAPTSGLGETSEAEAELYRSWALRVLRTRFPGFEIAVSDQDNATSVWTDIDDVQMNGNIATFVGTLWGYYSPNMSR